MKNFISILQILVSCLLIGAILLQAKGSGLGQAWGGGGEFYRSKRGMEKTLQIATIVLAVFFLLTSVISVLI